MKVLVLCEFSGRVRDSRAVGLLEILPDIPRKTPIGERRRIIADLLASQRPSLMSGKALESVRVRGRTQWAQQCAADELARRKASMHGALEIGRRVRAAGLGGLGDLGGLWGLLDLSARHPRIISTPVVDAFGILCFLRGAGAEHYRPATTERRLDHQWRRVNNLMAAYDRAVAAVEERCVQLGMPPGMYLEVRDSLGDPEQEARVWAALAHKGVVPPREYRRRDLNGLPPPVTIASILGELEARLPTARAVFARRTAGQDLSRFSEQEQIIAAGAPHIAALAEQRLRRWLNAVVGLGEFGKVDRLVLGSDLVDDLVEFTRKAARKTAADAISLPARPFSIFNLEP